MCGIAGWIDWEADLTRTDHRQVVENMGQTLACRGPDGRGSWFTKAAGFAHRRLVVVDPAGGGQPMVRRRGDQTFVVAYNGELYNTEELRRELVQKGYTFQGHSDTEVLLLSYMEWGADCLSRFNGIFAFAVWEDHTQTLFLARDRLGVKPLFYTVRHGGRTLLFGSELKALLAHPAVPPEVDREGLAEVFAMGPGRTPGHGVFRGVDELRPGHWLRFERGGGLHEQAYWQLQSRPHLDGLERTRQTVRELLADTVRRQLVSDVPICTLLSGGLDSSAVTALAAQALAAPLHTWSVEYQDNARFFQASDFQPDPDDPWARRVSEYLGTVHHRVVIQTPELVEALKAAVRARDLPGMADIDASLLVFSRAIKQEATVALSGEAADEVFGGYPWFRRMDDIQARQTFPWVRNLPWRMAVLKPEVREVIQPEQYVALRYQEALDEVPRLASEDPWDARMREIAYLSLTRFMATLLDRKDRMSMAVGLEVRVPYTDHRLVEYVWNIPWEMKTAGGQLKGILRQALDGVLPSDVLNRKKSPYPKTYHPAYTRAVASWLDEAVHDPASPLLELVDQKKVEQWIRAAQRQVTVWVTELAPSVAASASGVRASAQPSAAWGTGGKGTTTTPDWDLPWYGQLMTGPQLLAYLAQVDYWLREYKVHIV
ncbi:MAG: asparagine synthase (glutamine-hydrolyzing) [Limnochordaceae bacterium]|nr:asparagine synthase (glutamine-hydrolyzing) [Limnochordaceae bacterium]